MQTEPHTINSNNFSMPGMMEWITAGCLFALLAITHFTNILNPLTQSIGLDSGWMLYSIAYAVAIVIYGLIFIRRPFASYIAKMIMGIVFAFSIPTLMELLTTKGFTLSLYWPPSIDYIYPLHIMLYPLPTVLYAFQGLIIVAMVFVIRYGAPWCGIGVILSSEPTLRMRISKFLIGTVLVFVGIATAMMLLSWTTFDKIVAEVYESKQQLVANADSTLSFIKVRGTANMPAPFDTISCWEAERIDRRIFLFDRYSDEWALLALGNWPYGDAGEPKRSCRLILDAAPGLANGTACLECSEPTGSITGSFVRRHGGQTFELYFPKYPVLSKIVIRMQRIYAFVIVALLSIVFGAALCLPCTRQTRRQIHG